MLSPPMLLEARMFARTTNHITLQYEPAQARAKFISHDEDQRQMTWLDF